MGSHIKIVRKPLNSDIVRFKRRFRFAEDAIVRQLLSDKGDYIVIGRKSLFNCEFPIDRIFDVLKNPISLTEIEFRWFAVSLDLKYKHLIDLEEPIVELLMQSEITESISDGWRKIKDMRIGVSSKKITSIKYQLVESDFRSCGVFLHDSEAGTLDELMYAVLSDGKKRHEVVLNYFSREFKYLVI